MHTGGKKKKETKPVSAINTFPLCVTYRHVLFGKLQIRLKNLSQFASAKIDT